jgi:hypothetical protein
MTIEECWREYLSEFRQPPPGRARAIARNFFYTGAACMLALVADALDKDDNHESVALMTALGREMDLYREQATAEWFAEEEPVGSKPS